MFTGEMPIKIHISILLPLKRENNLKYACIYFIHISRNLQELSTLLLLMEIDYIYIYKRCGYNCG